MDNRNYIEETETKKEQVKQLFKEVASEGLFNTWADTFDIENIDKERVVITYSGNENVKKFKKECNDILASCIASVMRKKKKIKIVKKKGNSSSLSPKAKKNIKAVKFFVIGMMFICIATAVIVVLCNYIGNRNFRESFYSVSSIKVDSNVRIVQLSDLHRTSYGKNNSRLTERIKALKPDIIICTGDIVNSAETDAGYAVDLAEKISEIAPSYYIYGNNEVETVYDFKLNQEELDKKFGFNKNNRDEKALVELKDTFEEKLEKTGIKVLKNEKDTIKVKTMNVDVYGILTSNPSSFWSYSEKAFADYIFEDKENLKITAVHEPFIFEEFDHDFWGDLIVCGHTHGGVIRVPVIGPLYTTEGGLFPERNGCFVYGRYDVSGSPIVVSGGLENSNLLRINNEPELVVIDINKF